MGGAGGVELQGSSSSKQPQVDQPMPSLFSAAAAAAAAAGSLKREFSGMNGMNKLGSANSSNNIGDITDGTWEVRGVIQGTNESRNPEVCAIYDGVLTSIMSRSGQGSIKVFNDVTMDGLNPSGDP